MKRSYFGTKNKIAAKELYKLTKDELIDWIVCSEMSDDRIDAFLIDICGIKPSELAELT